MPEAPVAEGLAPLRAADFATVPEFHLWLIAALRAQASFLPDSRMGDVMLSAALEFERLDRRGVKYRCGAPNVTPAAQFANCRRIVAVEGTRCPHHRLKE
jgi:hypothetical protein